MLLSINITTLLWSFVLVPIVINSKIYVRNKDSNKKIEVELLEYFRLLCQTIRWYTLDTIIIKEISKLGRENVIIDYIL